MSHSIPHRGISGNPDGRFETHRRQAEADGWDLADDPLPPLATTVQVDASRSILTRNQSPGTPFDRSVIPPFLAGSARRIQGGHRRLLPAVAV